MLQRRTLVSAIGCAMAACVAPGAWAQRATQPIARPPGQRPGGPLARGRFSQEGGVASGALPGVYVVVAVDAEGETLQLRDDDGRTALVHVNEDRFDLGSLKTGDEVEVDFFVPNPGSNRIEAGGLWKVPR